MRFALKSSMTTPNTMTITVIRTIDASGLVAPTIVDSDWTLDTLPADDSTAMEFWACEAEFEALVSRMVAFPAFGGES